ncbi:hypothetical protein RN001_006700 [Aquatica leii]|uniref:Uncharacterized protein n=1 Tax=Aquatica leii TaxID=1421715 RepID=A0AAN7SBL1_9COLE|nr:hypothetical protein RN001_006700 [Aquatica leii]
MDKEVYLIGVPTDSIFGRKLPNFKDALSLFFYHHKVLKCDIKKSAFLTINIVEELWNKAQIPVRATQNSVNKLLGMFKKWRNLQRSSQRKKSPTQMKNENAFKIKLKGIFDIAHKYAQKNISEKQKEFLKAQRLPNRRGFFDESSQNLNENCDEMMELDDESMY